MSKKNHVRVNLTLDPKIEEVLRSYISTVFTGQRGDLMRTAEAAFKLFFVATGFSTYDGTVQEYIDEFLSGFKYEKKEPHMYKPEK